jgi:Zn finger protein HypA/HybF involved in hydrogenase expression
MTTSTAITLECLECGKTWKAPVKVLTSGNPRCPKCRGYDVDLA